jgi:hypothetical protein
MAAKQMLHVLANRTGKIIGLALVGDDSDHPDSVRTQVMPMEGQRLVKARMAPEHGKLESAEDFLRLSKEFHVPRGRTELVRKRPAPAPNKKRRRAA